MGRDSAVVLVKRLGCEDRLREPADVFVVGLVDTQSRETARVEFAFEIITPARVAELFVIWPT